MSHGFTLIEVLLALAIIAIAFTALLKATSMDITGTQHIKDKTISHWVAAQGVTLIQLGLLGKDAHTELSEVTTLFNQRWYWRATIKPTTIHAIQEIHISVSKNQTGPFREELMAYRYNTP
jgi:general secretion pathway protein I